MQLQVVVLPALGLVSLEVDARQALEVCLDFAHFAQQNITKLLELPGNQTQYLRPTEASIGHSSHLLEDDVVEDSNQ